MLDAFLIINALPPYVSAKTLAPTFSMVHLLHRLYGVDALRSIGFTVLRSGKASTRYTLYSIMSITLQRYLWLRNTKYAHNNNHQQVRNNSYLTDRDKTAGHNYRENSEINDRLFNSVNPSLHERCGCCSAVAGRLNSLNFTYTKKYSSCPIGVMQGN